MIDEYIHTFFLLANMLSFISQHVVLGPFVCISYSITTCQQLQTYSDNIAIVVNVVDIWSSLYRFTSAPEKACKF